MEVGIHPSIPRDCPAPLPAGRPCHGGDLRRRRDPRRQHRPSLGTIEAIRGGRDPSPGRSRPAEPLPARRCRCYETRSVQTTGTTASAAGGTLRLQQELLLVKMGSGDS